MLRTLSTLLNCGVGWVRGITRRPLSSIAAPSPSPPPTLFTLALCPLCPTFYINTAAFSLPLQIMAILISLSLLTLLIPVLLPFITEQRAAPMLLHPTYTTTELLLLDDSLSPSLVLTLTPFSCSSLLTHLHATSQTIQLPSDCNFLAFPSSVAS